MFDFFVFVQQWKGAVAQLTAQAEDMQTLLSSLQTVGRVAQIELENDR